MNVIIEVISKYLLIILMSIYTFQCFFVFRFNEDRERNGIYLRQNINMILIYLLAFVVMLMETMDIRYLVFYCISQIFILLVIVAYRLIYPAANKLIVNNMCMLLSVGFIILSRLSYDKAFKQFIIATISIICTALIPFVLKKFKGLRKFYPVFAGIGIAFLLAVLLFSTVINGSKLNLKIAGVTFQPSEFVKLLFVFTISGILSKKQNIKAVLISLGIAFIHIMLLVGAKDLGSAIIFFIVYLAILFVATGNYLYFIFGILSGGIGSVIGYKLFSHVRVRVLAWKDPLGNIENAGYQIAQSLFAIGTGGFFGMGLFGGAPNKIPVVEADFIFAAISEELGVLFALCVILICVSCYVMFMNIAMRFNDLFYKLVAVGLATTYGFQVFLTIGGVTKFIPLTGVTLPLVSYGGNSIMVTLIMFAVIQGLYISVKDSNKKISNQIF